MSSPPVVLPKVCANGKGRLRKIRPRKMSAGILVLAASILFLAGLRPAAAEFPIRQLPAGQGSGVRSQGSGVAIQGPAAIGQWFGAKSPTTSLVSGPATQAAPASPPLPQ